jgi:hypothetical protein
MSFDEGQKIFAAHVQTVIDEAVETGIVAEGQVAFEKDAVMAVQKGYNRRSEALCKAVVRRHGVLLPGPVW